MKKKNIFCLIGQLGNGGTEKQLYLFLKYLDREQYNPTVVVSSSGEGKWKKAIEELSVPVISLCGMNQVFKLLKFRYLVFKHKPEVILSWSFFTNAFYMFAGRSRFIGGLRGDLYVAREKLQPFHRAKSLDNESFIVNSSLLKKELLQEGIKEVKINLIHNIYERNKNFSEKPYLEKWRNELRKKMEVSEDTILVASIARNTPEKDIPFFIDVFQKAAEKMPELKAFLIGEGGTAFADEIKRRGLSEKFILTGHYENASELLPAADIYFLSSRTEGMPNVLLEAIDAGCGVFSTDVGGVGDILSELGEELFSEVILKDRDIDSSAEKLIKTAQNPALRKKIAEKGGECLKQFLPEKIMSGYYEVLKHIES